MLHDFVNFDALDRVRLEHSVDQIAHIPRDVVRKKEPSLADFLEQHAQLVIVEGERAADHRVQNDSAGPDVDVLASIALATDDLGRCIVGRAAGRRERHAVLHRVGQAEVDQLDVVVFVQQQVLGLQVTVCLAVVV